jgi:isocitrate dehydrogenase
MTENKKITVSYGDGIGPEIMEATLRILKDAGAKIHIETVEVGAEVYKRDNTTGISTSAWDSIKTTKVMLKSPITTPQGGGYKSLNVTFRKTLGLYVNLRPCIAYAPYISTQHPNLDIIIVRENEEDLYAGIEYRPTHNMYKSLKLITRTGCEKIIRYAFEYALKNNRKKVTCFSKDNIMKFTDGIFHKVFDEVRQEYSTLESDHYIVDIGSAKLASKPEIFDVIVTSNLYGDIISDIIAETSGSVGLAGSANIGNGYAMFEAVHGSAPDIADKDIANPSGILNASIMMLLHIGQPKIAALIQNAWLKTLEDGVHTADIYNEKISTKKVGTKEFASEVIKRLGQKPIKIKENSHAEVKEKIVEYQPVINMKEKKLLVGVDVYLDWQGDDINYLAKQIQSIADGKLKLQMISSKGLKIWPVNITNKLDGDYFSLRFVPDNHEKVTTHQEVVYLLNNMSAINLDFVQIENLYSFDDKLGFSLSQGE